MKNNVKWIIIAITLVVLIGGATIIYNNLTEDFGGDSLLQNTTEANSNSNENSQTDEKIKAPDFTVLDYDGNEVKLSDYKGKPVVLNFWATWCFYCKEEMPDFNTAYEKYPDVEFLMLNATDGYQETIEDARSHITEKGYTFPEPAVKTKPVPNVQEVVKVDLVDYDIPKESIVEQNTSILSNKNSTSIAVEIITANSTVRLYNGADTEVINNALRCIGGMSHAW